jgi:hypothetical protein
MSNIVLIIIIMFVVAIVAFLKREGFCNCSGMANMSSRPAYFAYRPFGDVSDYSTPYTESKIHPMTNLGWKTNMPGDAFDQDNSRFFGNSWAAGSNPNPNDTSVPLVSFKHDNHIHSYSTSDAGVGVL